MKLHIVPDSKFIDTFYSNLESLSLLADNKLVVNTQKPRLTFIKHDVFYAPIYSKKFSEHVGDTSAYEEVFIHLFNPMMYRWVAGQSFRKLSWCVWGTDLYHLPGLSRKLYEPETWNSFRKNYFTRHELMYQIKLQVTNMPFRRRAYSKVDRILTWMKTEYEFCRKHLRGINSSWDFFFYENSLPYQALDAAKASYKPDVIEKGGQFLLMVGNSGTDTNNHIDAIRMIADRGIPADLIVPVSYGDENYVRFLKENTGFYKNGKVIFLDQFLGFDEYVKLLLSLDGLVMNHIRPQGYGNILMMMYLDKPVFLNSRNYSLPDLDANNLLWAALDQISVESLSKRKLNNREAVIKLLSHERLEQVYKDLFR